MNNMQYVSEKEMIGKEQVSSTDPSQNVPMLVLSGDELKETVNSIVSKMEEVVSRTMGPYGKNAIIQRINAVDITKDGYLTARALNIGNNIAEKSLCSVCMDVIASTNVTAGDGTSSTIEVAASLHRQVQEYLEDNFMNVRDLENTLNEVSRIIQDKLLETATKITDENLEDAIRKIALVSTNWDEELADIITNIYKETHNPIIKRVDSGSEETYYEIIDGYDLAAHLILQDTYLTDMENRTRVVLKPFILVFDNTLPDDILDSLCFLANYAGTKGIEELVVLAKGFTTTLVNRVAAMNTRALKNGSNLMPITLVEYHAPSAIDRECVLDFCDLIGAEVISGDSEIRVKIDRLSKEIHTVFPGTDKEKKEAIAQSVASLFEDELMEVAGACLELTIGDKRLVAKGVDSESEIIEKKKKKLELEIKEALQNATAKSMVTNSINTKQIRLGKLNCRMGIIHVGGRGPAHLKSRNDAVDDAIRACQLAYTSGGYTIGGCYAVPWVWQSCIKQLTKNASDSVIETDKAIDIIKFGTMVSRAFVDAIHTVATNKYGNGVSPELVNVIENGIFSGVPINIITERADENLIEPVMVDIAIINSALSLVLTLETTDQYLYTAYENLG